MALGEETFSALSQLSVAIPHDLTETIGSRFTTECIRGKKSDGLVSPEATTHLYAISAAHGRPCADGGVPDLLFHDLRRTAARNLRRAGVAEGVIMKIGGWKAPDSLSSIDILNVLAKTYQGTYTTSHVTSASTQET